MSDKPYRDETGEDEKRAELLNYMDGSQIAFPDIYHGFVYAFGQQPGTQQENASSDNQVTGAEQTIEGFSNNLSFHIRFLSSLPSLLRD